MRFRNLIVLAALASQGVAAATITAEELVAKNLQARGGAAKLQAISSMHTLGKMRLGGGQEAKTESWAIVPDHYRDDFSLQGMTAVESWDGVQAWRVTPWEGRRDPQKISPDDAKELIEAADIAGPLLDYRAKGSKIEYLGTEDIDGTDAHKLRVSFKNGDSWVVYLDPDQFLEIRIVAHRMVRGQEQVNSVDLGEYEQVDGVYFPFEVGRNQIEKIELNQALDPKMFPFPAAAKP